MPKRGCGPTGLPSEPAPKSAAFRVDDARAARDGAWRSQTTASWQPRRSRAGLEARRGPLLDATPTCRFAAEGSLCGEADAGTSLARGSALHIVLGGCPHRAAPDECARDPGRRTAAPRRGGVVLASGRALIFCKARGFSSVRWRDLGAATNNLPKNPHPRRLHGRNGVVRASLLPGRRRAAKSVQVVLQRRSKWQPQASQAGFRACRTLRRRRPTPEQRAPRPKAPKKRSLHTRRVGTKKCSPSAGCSYYLPRRARSCACRRRRRTRCWRSSAATASRWPGRRR